MKSLKIFLSLLAAIAIAAPAFAAEVTWSGGADARIGFQNSKGEASGSKAQNKLGLPTQDAAGKFIGDFKDGKLEMKAGFQINSTKSIGADGAKTAGLGLEEGWVSYNFGPAVLKFHGNGIQSRWDSDMEGIDNGGYNSLDVYAMSMVFFTIMGVDNGAGYQNVKDAKDGSGSTARVIPCLSTGVDGTFGPAALKAGIVLDKPVKTKAVAATKTAAAKPATGDYTGWMLFVNENTTLGAIGVGVSALYGKAIGAFAKQDTTTNKKSTYMAVRIPFSYSLGGPMSVGLTPAWTSMNKYDGKNKKTYTYAEVWFKYALDNNFSVKPVVSYEIIKDDAKTGKKELTMYVNLGYSF